MLWSLMKEFPSLRGVVDFHDTGTTFEADDPQPILNQLQAADGCSYSAQPAPLGAGAAIGRAFKRLTGGRV